MTERYCRELITNALERKVQPKWALISKSGTLSESFIREFAPYLYWDLILKHQKVSEQFIREMKPHINWLYCCVYKPMSEKFIEENIENIRWDYISKTQRLSEEFMRRYEDKFIFFHLTEAPKNASDDFFKRYNEKFSGLFRSKYKRKFEKLGLI